MNDTTEALPPLPPAAYGNDCTTEEEAYTADQMRDYARAALAQRQQVPEGWADLRGVIESYANAKADLALHPTHESAKAYFKIIAGQLRDVLAALTAAPSAQEKP